MNPAFMTLLIINNNNVYLIECPNQQESFEKATTDCNPFKYFITGAE